MYYPYINKKKTARKIRSIIEESRFSLQEICDFLCLSNVHAIYHWTEGISLPSIDNFYALSVLTDVHIDDMIICDKPDPETARFDRIKTYLRSLIDVYRSQER